MKRYLPAKGGEIKIPAEISQGASPSIVPTLPTASREHEAVLLDRECADAALALGDDLEGRAARERQLLDRLRKLDEEAAPDAANQVQAGKCAFEIELLGLIDAPAVDRPRIFLSAAHLHLAPLVHCGLLSPIHARRFMEAAASLYRNLGLVRRADLDVLITHGISGTIARTMPRLLSRKYRSE
jgi:hypothetical protein